MGGYGTWFTAMARPDLFAAIAPVCGGGMAWNAEVLKMPIWTFHGTEDDVVSPYQTDEMVAKLKALNADVTYTRVNGVGHNVWENAYNTELFEWLLSKKENNIKEQAVDIRFEYLPPVLCCSKYYRFTNQKDK